MSNTFFELIAASNAPPPQGILQVGASYGQELQQFLDHGITRAVLVEPLPEPFAYIADICKAMPGFIAFNGLCSDFSNKPHTFHVASNGGMSSSILPPKKHLEMFGRVRFDQTVEINSTTVDDLTAFLKLHGYGPITDALDTLYMDVQGAEYKVLLGAPRTLQSFNYVYMELIRGELYEGMQPLATYCALMEAHGFTLNNLNFNAQHHAEALFIRKSLLNL